MGRDREQGRLEASEPMSNPLRFKPVNPAHDMVFSADGGWVSWEDYARIKAEVERLTAFTTRTIIPNEELQAQVERLTKAVMHSPAAQLKLKELEGKTTFDEINPDNQ